MSKQSLVLKVKGLFRQPNNLGSIPDGALEEAENVYIRREDTAEPRRGFNFYGPSFGISTDRAKQLLIYKKRIIRHYSDIISRDDGSGIFTDYSGSFNSPDSKMKIRGIELNGNFYITTDKGIQRLDDLPSQFQPAGVTRALDLEAELVDAEGFFEADNQVAYRILWGFKDANNNLLLGSPSERVVLANSGNALIIQDFNNLLQAIDTSGFGLLTDYVADLTLPTSATNADILGEVTPVLKGLKGLANKLTNDPGNTTLFDFEVLVGTKNDFTSLANYFDDIVSSLDAQIYVTTPFNIEARRSQQAKLRFTVPDEVTVDYFYQIYRSALSGDINATPLVELQLVFEGNPTSTQITSKLVEVIDITPDSFRGADLYTNPNQQGIIQSNDRPPFAKDITTFKNAVFFANTKTLQRLNISQLTTNINSGTITGVAIGDPAVITSPNHGLTDGQTIEILGTGVAGVDAVHVITVINSNSFSIPVEALSSSTVGTWRTGLNDSSTLTFTDGTNSFTLGFSLAAEDAANGIARYYLSGTPAQNVDDTARSIIRVINRFTDNTFIYAIYQADGSSVPGKILLEARDINNAAFHITAGDAETGSCFDPIIPISGSSVISTNEVSPHRVFFSKTQQPDAVPILNYFDVGRKDSEILRIVGLRDSLFIFKEDGIFRAIGDSIQNLTISSFDSSIRITAPESAAIGNNQIFLITDQGVIRLSDTGRDVISRSIEDLVLPLNSPRFTNFTTATFGLFYTTERQYYLWTVTEEDDQYATRCFVFNTFTEAWTVLPISKTCGIVSIAGDKLYLGAGDINWLEQERKNFDKKDYSDRQYDTQIVSFSGKDLIVNTVANMQVGDTITQKEYLNPFKFNTVLWKLDSDAGLVDNDYTTLEVSTKSQLNNAVDDLALKLDNDISLPILSGSITAITPLVTTTQITSPGHGLTTGQYITISGTDSTPDVDGFHQVTVLNINNFTINKVTTMAGTTGSWTASYVTAATGGSNPIEIQDRFNRLINTLNGDPRVVDIDYELSTSTLEFFTHVIEIQDDLELKVIVQDEFDWDTFDITYYNHIPTKVTWAPLHAGDPSIFKQFSEAELMFSETTGQVLDLSFASDIIQGFDKVEFFANTDSGWGVDPWGLDPWGDYPGSRNFRTYIPKNQSRCRFMQPRFEHSRAFEMFLMVGLSLTFTAIGERTNK